MSNVAILKPKTAIEKRTHTTVDTISLSVERIGKWRLPSGQRPLRENAKVRALALKITKDEGVLPGMLTLGVLDGTYWIIDGQHRLRAFILSGVREGYADVRYVHAESMSEINREFVELNSKLVSMRPDDFLRGLEGTIPTLARIRASCPFVGYDLIRRGNSAPIVSMSAALRNWRNSATDTPASSSAVSAVELAETLVDEEARGLIDFLQIAVQSFGREPEYCRLWAGLNITLCMWLYRRLVITQYSPKSPRIEKALFAKCLMSVSADSVYQDWLLGRKLGERDRTPAYARLKTIFARRLEQELGRKIALPAPSWSSS